MTALAREFAAHYLVDAGHHVFWRSNPDRTTGFRLREFLFDIAVCHVCHTPSLQPLPQDLLFVSHCDWLVESEFAPNTRDIVLDMSKPVVGQADNKLFVAAQRGPNTERDLLDRCARIATCCRGRVFFIFVAHPDRWDRAPEDPRLHAWSADGWQATAFPPN